jgi:hypothetical protein
LLTAIGETPYMWRANYPVSSRHYPVAFQSDLRPFSLEALAQFIRIEMPPLADDDKRFLQEKEIPIARKDGVDAAGEFNSIAALYLEIERLFEDLDAVGSLFIGPPSAQIGLSSILPFSGFLRGISVPANARMYDIELLPVCDLKSAKASIRQVLDEGEGGGAILEPQSHFGRFVAMYIAFRDELARCPQFAPARPVGTTAASRSSPIPRRAASPSCSTPLMAPCCCCSSDFSPTPTALPRKSRRFKALLFFRS